MKRALQTIEVLLYALFMVDCFVLLVQSVQSRDYFPPGGISLIVILLLIGLVQRLRGGPHYMD